MSARHGASLLPAVLGALAAPGVPSFWQTALLSLVRVLAGLLAALCWGAAAALTCASRWADCPVHPRSIGSPGRASGSFILFVLLWTRRGLVPVVVSA